MVRAPALHAGCRGFESLFAHRILADPAVRNGVYLFTALEVRIDMRVTCQPKLILGLIAVTLWRTKMAVFPLALAWFAAMLPATLVIGGHYFVDLIAGILVWVIWFAISLRIVPATERQTQQQLTNFRRQSLDTN